MKTRITIIILFWFTIELYAQEKTSGNKDIASEVTFSQDEVNQLFSIARNSIQIMLFENKKQVIDPAAVPRDLMKNFGAFVTINVDRKMRGCVGRFVSADPLYEVVNQMAVISAFGDTRFDPVTKEDFNKMRLEISVLGPLQKIRDTSEIVMGRHGIYIQKGTSTGTMLPQVATGNRWTKAEFLGYTSRDKAGLGWDGWKDADIYIYEAVVLEEKY